MIWLLPATIAGYLLGCFTTGYYLGMAVKKLDIRRFGSGNAGATNTLRVWGASMALLVLVGDVSKAVLAVLLGRYLGGLAGGTVLGVGTDLVFGYAAGLMVVMGHNWPVFTGFRGGKGMGPSLGVALVCSPWLALGLVGLMITVVVITRYVSLGAIISATVLFVVALVIQGLQGFTDIPILILYGLITLMAVYSHRENIGRLIAGTENKMKFKKKA